MSLELIIGVVVAFISLFSWGKYQSSQKDKYKSQASQEKSNHEYTKERVKAHEARQKIDDDIAMGDEPLIDERLLKYTRDSKNTKL
ncbi:hypothetical protein [Vibrio casei]|uniref:hypothetical protein n=1 Tax=Vibrio casei TaxID=673372 RepID=UPI003F9C21FD